MKTETRALLNEMRRAVAALAQHVSEWSEEKARRAMPGDTNSTYLSALKKGVGTIYEYIVWIEKTAGLPRLHAPSHLENLDKADLKGVVTTISLLAPFSSESLAGLTDEQLQYRPVRDYTLAQMLEHAIVSVWLLLGQVEKQ